MMEEIKHEKALRLVKIAGGQLGKVQDMIENNSYCIDISIQLLAVISLLKKANTEVLVKHMETCVTNAKSEEDKSEKIKELERIFEMLEKTY